MKPVDVDIVLNGCDYRKMVEFVVEDGKRERHYLYYDGEAVSGKVWSVLISVIWNIYADFNQANWMHLDVDAKVFGKLLVCLHLEYLILLMLINDVKYLLDHSAVILSETDGPDVITGNSVA